MLRFVHYALAVKKLFVRYFVLAVTLLVTIFFSGGGFAMQITSSAFVHQGAIPSKYTCEGDDISPDLAWSGVPGNARSLVLVIDDPDASAGTWTHWILYNLPTTVSGLDENVRALPVGTAVGINSWGKKKPGYGGPCPPSGEHRYFFTLYALDVELDAAAVAPADGRALQRAMQGHVLEKAVLMGRYQRRSK
jgi:Raf kinase inhibitor-like YbhB/YbcL family protein